MHAGMCLQAGSGLHGSDEGELQAKMRDLVRHIRDRKLRMTFTDTLGQAGTWHPSCMQRQ